MLLLLPPPQRSAAEAAHEQASERIKASQQRIREGIAAGREALAAEQARRREAVLGLKGSLAAVRAEVAAQVGREGGREGGGARTQVRGRLETRTTLSGPWGALSSRRFWHQGRGTNTLAHVVFRR